MAEAPRVSATVDEPPWLAAYPSDVEWQASYPQRPLYELLDDAVARYGDRRCLDFLDKTWSYDEIGRLVDRAARGLQALGVGPGSKVGLLLPNCPYFVISFFAVLKIGGTVVNYNPLYTEREIEHQIEDSETDVMVTLDLELLLPKLCTLLERTRLKAIIVGKMADILPFPKNLLFPWVKRHELAEVPGEPRFVWFNDLVANDGRYHAVVIDPATDLAVLQYTGGTTGVPKGAALTHHNLQANAEQTVAWHPGAALGEERILGILPLFHVFALSAVLDYGIRVGAEIILLPRFELTTVLQTIARKRPTMLPGVPTLYNAINHCPELEKYDLSSLRYCVSGGAALPREVQQTFERLSGCTMVEGYGLTEAPVVTCNPVQGARKPGSIGLPLPGTVIEVVSLDDRRTVLPRGERGEICVRGPQVMSGYWRAPEDSADALRDGRLHTGDIGYMDEAGYFYIVDRLKELIICSGYNVYPRVVEEAIYQHPDVAEVAVCGVPDDYRGETVKAFIVPREPAALTEADLLEFLADKLSPIELPKLIEWREHLPKSAVGKILKKQLVQEHLERAA